MSAFSDWAARSNTVKIYLVELTVLRLADQTPIVLYLSNFPADLNDHCYLPCVSGLPRLTRQASDFQAASYVPSWGELEIFIEPTYRPDPANAVAWATLLDSSSYSFAGQPCTILLGGEGFNYADFQPVFAGYVNGVNYDANTLTLELADKSVWLERKEIPSYEIPEDDTVPEGSWGQYAPEVYGRVKNYTPPLIKDNNGTNNKYILAGHVVSRVLAVYFAGVTALTNYTFTPRDYSPVAKTGDGLATLTPSGAYTGSAFSRSWLAQIDSIDDGEAIGEATFRWSKDNGVTWEAGGLPTWMGQVDVDSLEQTPAGDTVGIIEVATTYTGTELLAYRLEFTSTDVCGVATYRYTTNGGSSWSGSITTPASGSSHTLDGGVVVTFRDGVGLPQGFTNGEYWDWSIEELSVDLAEGLAVRFTSNGAFDFALWDEFRFIMVSTLTCSPGENNEVTVDVDGKVFQSPAFGAYLLTMTANNAPAPLVASASSEISGEDHMYWAYYAFDGGINVFHSWQATGPTGWLRLDLGAGNAQAFAGYTIAKRIYSWPDAPKSWTLEASNDGLAWTVLDTQSNITDWDDTRKTFQFVNTTAYRYWKLDISAGNFLYVAVGELYFMLTAAGTYSPRVGDIIRDILATYLDWQDGVDYDTADLTALNTAFPQTFGLLVDSPTSIGQIIDSLLAGLPAMYFMSNDGRFKINEITGDFTGAEAVVTLTDEDILSLSRRYDLGNNFYRVILNWDRCWSTVGSEAGIDPSVYQWLQKDWRTFTTRDDTIRNRYPLATELGPLDTAIVADSYIGSPYDPKIIQPLAGKLLDLYDRPPEFLEIVTKNQPFVSDLYEPLTINSDKFQISQTYRILGLDRDFTANEATVTLWKK